jgi:pimeloyl-ACP methyl ester carboxylesterase
VAKTTPALIAHREENNEAAIIFVHGFGGNAEETWGRFPELVRKSKAVNKWDIYSLGYATKLRFDLIGIWEADPDIPKLALYLRTACTTPPLDRYKSLALIAHSMGGLVVQRALIDFDELTEPVTHVFLFGTPSAGLRKASLFRWLKRQMRDMSYKRPFIKDLRKRWEQKFSKKAGKTHPFRFWSAAGDRDEFVTGEASIEAFPKEEFPDVELAVVSGNHLEIVKPPDVEHLSFKLVVKGLRGKAGAVGPWNGAALAVETRDFKRAIALLEPHKNELDDDALVQLALAMEGTGRTKEALEILKNSQRSSTDAMGVLAGRLKRRWLAERRDEDARKARELYNNAFKLAEAANDHDQAFYHGINIAFMDLAYGTNRAEAKAKAHRMATKVLAHCALADPGKWRYATEGEAQLIAGHTSEAIERYEAYLNENPKPRDIESTYQQAKKVADLLGNTKGAAKLDSIFIGG